MFSTTTDLDAEFPALAARQLGWIDVALMCVHELDVPGSLRRCIRILLHWNTDKPADEIVHVYIKEAARLRPDRSNLPPVDWKELEQWIAEHSNEHGGKVKPAMRKGRCRKGKCRQGMTFAIFFSPIFLFLHLLLPQSSSPSLWGREYVASITRSSRPAY